MVALELLVCGVTVPDVGLELGVLPEPLATHLTQVRPDPQVHLVDVLLQSTAMSKKHYYNYQYTEIQSLS